MKKFWIWMRVAAAAGLIALPGTGASPELFKATLAGDTEVPPNNTPATGVFMMTVDNSTSTPVINFTFTYSDLSANPTAAHIHFGQPNVAAGVMVFLCGGGGQPACPAATSATINGTITAANVTGPAAQGVAAGNLTAALEAIGDGLGYANIHNSVFPGGEMRGQVHRVILRGRGGDH